MMVVLPDSVFLSLIYRLKTGRVLHLKNPQRMSEKIQHYKAYYRDEKCFLVRINILFVM